MKRLEEEADVATGSNTFTLTVRKRPWWFWALGVAGAFMEVLLVQTAMASVREEEYRAASICWIAGAVVAIIGAFGWLHQGRSNPQDSTGASH